MIEHDPPEPAANVRDHAVVSQSYDTRNFPPLLAPTWHVPPAVHVVPEIGSI
ncbi:MAG: hypothetical protein LC722_04805 [Actinobacteria bacterium]|nr:hypothetical protein [Actinomycetota bacterium]